MIIKFSEGQHTQFAIAAASLAFGAWCILSPDSVVALAARDEFQLGRPLAPLAIAAIGAQAAAAGLFAAFRRFKSWTFPGFALSFLPILLLDWWLYAVAGAFSSMILVHAAGLLAVLGLCARGFFALRSDELAAERAA